MSKINAKISDRIYKKYAQSENNSEVRTHYYSVQLIHNQLH